MSIDIIARGLAAKAGVDANAAAAIAIQAASEAGVVMSNLTAQVNSKLTYHETAHKNWFNNRGNTSYFVVKCEVLDKNPIGSNFNPEENKGHLGYSDTVYVVIVDKSRLKY